MTIDLNKTFNYPSFQNPIHQIPIKPIIPRPPLQNEINLRDLNLPGPPLNPGPYGGLGCSPPDLFPIDRFNEKNKW